MTAPNGRWPCNAKNLRRYLWRELHLLHSPIRQSRKHGRQPWITHQRSRNLIKSRNHRFTSHKTFLNTREHYSWPSIHGSGNPGSEGGVGAPRGTEIRILKEIGTLTWGYLCSIGIFTGCLGGSRMTTGSAMTGFSIRSSNWISNCVSIYSFFGCDANFWQHCGLQPQ